MAAKSHNFTLGPDSSKELEKLAKKLNITEAEVLRKGMLVMGLYAQFQDDGRKIIVQDDENDTKTELRLA